MQMYTPHPGEVLREFMGATAVTAFAARVGVSRTTISRLLNGHLGISAAMAITLSEVLKTSPEMWMGLQMQYDLSHARRERKKILLGRNASLKKAA